MARKIQLVLFLILSLAVLGFIFSNSLETSDVSDQRSNGIVDVIKPVIDPHDKIPHHRFNHYVRKAAHFSEFAALGFCLMGLFDAAGKKKKALQILPAFVISVIIAALDETLQFFSAGRGPRVGDVLIDSSGAAFGVCVMLFILWLIRKRKEKNPSCEKH